MGRSGNGASPVVGVVGVVSVPPPPVVWVVASLVDPALVVIDPVVLGSVAVPDPQARMPGTKRARRRTWWGRWFVMAGLQPAYPASPEAAR